MPVDTGTGATITFGTSSWSANILSIDWSGLSRDSIETTHLGTTAAKTFIPEDLYDSGEVSLDFQFDVDDFPPIDQAAETITITAPLSSSGSTAGKWAATGFMTDFSFNVTTGAELMSGSATVKFTGAITPTDES